ncbi:hypothetical protein [Candidatus Vidania fulgoroideorum]
MIKKYLTIFKDTSSNKKYITRIAIDYKKKKKYINNFFNYIKIDISSSSSIVYNKKSKLKNKKIGRISKFKKKYEMDGF